jgi:regulator of sirC expression with transglutaminase-like and TPR domain
MAKFHDATQAKDFLIDIGKADDKDIDIVEAAMAFALLTSPDADIDEARRHVTTFAKDLKTLFIKLAEIQNSDNVQVRAQALKTVMADDFGYLGDDVNYDDLRNVNLFEVIKRRLGLPITLCILAIGTSRSIGWSVEGVNFPGHFIMRIDHDGDRLLIDPFQGCKILEAKDLRLILKRIMGEYAELTAHFYEPCTNREILLRLQNNIKYRLIDSGQYKDALAIVQTMTWIAPDDYRLHLDQAVLLSRLDQPKAAIEHLEHYIADVTDPHDKAEAEAFIMQLKGILH